MCFSERLKSLRLQHKLTQSQLAKAVGITERACRYFEAGSREPSYSVLLAIADYFTCSLDYLTGRSDNPKRR